MLYDTKVWCKDELDIKKNRSDSDLRGKALR